MLLLRSLDASSRHSWSSLLIWVLRQLDASLRGIYRPEVVDFSTLKEVGSNAHRETPMSGSSWSPLPQFSSDEFITSFVGGEAQENCGSHALYRWAHTIPPGSVDS